MWVGRIPVVAVVLTLAAATAFGWLGARPAAADMGAAVDTITYAIREIGRGMEAERSAICGASVDCGREVVDEWVVDEENRLLNLHGDSLTLFAEETAVAHEVRYYLACPDGARLLILHRCLPDACSEYEAFTLVDAETREVDVIWVRPEGVVIRGPRYPMLRGIGGWFLRSMRGLDGD